MNEEETCTFESKTTATNEKRNQEIQKDQQEQ